ncbi:glutamate--tRNA ligase [Enterobacteriaceae endosymbiont of Neohaemonia nigricornis]|uniref:glutamate--tRNA ligase n=1 Tax=Enterobacteriaceae endosymbiont of Neohaemonia nigricornis TaxID=2675792 RepID=UPI00144993D4|nr:glutamate--tRNA ligase [Enterobacteriaceae endosymbiont of Neohaemonia nigricornis]QJC30227.1 glutamate--tRNA ligase [Enterobacteriaceae endosymbiont of Neohaemonia nigricornis]
MKIITRFAPSPSGYLHIGNIRTALYSWLFARKNNGIFILRIEDTNAKKIQNNFLENIVNSLKWLNIDWDKGPYLQSTKLNTYKKIINNMLNKGIAYKCYCSKSLLKKDKEKQILLGIKTKYNGRCRNNTIKQNIPYVVRFRMPHIGSTTFKDLVRGNITINNIELDDFIIQRSDGTPTYNFCVVIDDLDMNITHIIRGEEHINNTPKQINIIKALNKPIPYYVHVSIITNKFGKKISKKHQDINILQYKKDGYLPQALLNYILRLGWSYGNKEIFTLQEMKQLFSLKQLNKSPSIFDINKLNWLNKYYLKQLSKDYMMNYLINFCKNKNFDINNGPTIQNIYDIFYNRCNTLQEINNLCLIFYTKPNYKTNNQSLLFLNQNTKYILKTIYMSFISIQQWSIININLTIKQITKELNLSFSKIAMPLRFVITGSNISPPIHEIIYLMGKNKTIKHIINAINFINKK